MSTYRSIFFEILLLHPFNYSDFADCRSSKAPFSCFPLTVRRNSNNLTQNPAHLQLTTRWHRRENILSIPCSFLGSYIFLKFSSLVSCKHIKLNLFRRLFADSVTQVLHVRSDSWVSCIAASLGGTQIWWVIPKKNLLESHDLESLMRVNGITATAQSQTSWRAGSTTRYLWRFWSVPIPTQFKVKTLGRCCRKGKTKTPLERTWPQ